MALIYAKEAYDIMSSAFHVYNVLKEGFLEPVYQEALEIEFKKNNIPFKREKLNFPSIMMVINFRKPLEPTSFVMIQSFWN